MVQLTVTAAGKAAVEEYCRLKTADGEGEGNERLETLSKTDLGSPVDHHELVGISKYLVGKHRDSSEVAKEWRLETLLKGAVVYQPPPPPKPEKSLEYKALMQRLREQEEQRQYERMTNPPSQPESFTQHFPNAPKPFGAGLDVGYNAADDVDDVTFADVNRQMVLIINVLISIICTSVAVWMAARRWSVPERLGLSFSSSTVVAVAEVAIYMGYIRRIKDAKTREKKSTEKKEIVDTWVIDAKSSSQQAKSFSSTADSSDTIRFRKEQAFRTRDEDHALNQLRKLTTHDIYQDGIGFLHEGTPKLLATQTSSAPLTSFFLFKYLHMACPSTQFYQNDSYIAEIWSWFGIGTLVVFARLVLRISRVGLSRLQGDDYLALAVWFCFVMKSIALTTVFEWGSNMDYGAAHVGELGDCQLERVRRGSGMELLAWYTYCSIIWGLKGIVLFMFRRLTFTLDRPRYFTFVWVVTAATYIAMILTLTLGCLPFQLNWQVKPPPPAKCSLRMHDVYVSTILNVLTDILILAIPLPALWKMSIDFWKKVGLVLLLCSGIFVITAALVRFGFTLVGSTSVNLNRWCQRETTVGIIAVNAAVLRSWFKRRRPRGGADLHGIEAMTMWPEMGDPVSSPVMPILAKSPVVTTSEDTTDSAWDTPPHGLSIVASSKMEASMA
ncbi:hypothetical protein M409DRAFT_16376 [Zasmidium cellare ATCC 36951]|uniref:Rhodopsin domain-containing protein n=1 Tax=Zasmidium cellare ATCC 36951 TaxID=1080233 RepID=A0A6A6D4Q0_ZASCE|nr:uncharacterized protein M409DRAFT_16376 [Zasmidium cellare ATCC 36951]KAF2174103.1 hypothetical protein M409DRAFT_16376 [Zasmidium cellare ATCC 36951]